MNIRNWDWSLEREPELCSFLMLADDPHCVICGKRCEHGMEQWHAGPEIRVEGWLDVQEYHKLDADIWRGLKLPVRQGQDVPDIPIFITGSEPINATTHRYSFAGGVHVGANQDMPIARPGTM